MNFYEFFNKIKCFILFEGVTTMLNYFTTSNSFRRTLPDVANLTAMNVWDGVCMCFVFASFVEFVIVNCTGRRIIKPNTSCILGNGNISKVRLLTIVLFIQFSHEKTLKRTLYHPLLRGSM